MLTSYHNNSIQIHALLNQFTHVLILLIKDDMNLDGWVDVVAWGSQDNQTNCIVSYLYSPNSTNNTFVSGPQYTGINQTSNPFVISYGKSNA